MLVVRFLAVLLAAAGYLCSQNIQTVFPAVVGAVPGAAIGPTISQEYFGTPTGIARRGVFYDAAGPAIFVASLQAVYSFPLPRPLVSWAWSGAGGGAVQGCWDELVMWDGVDLLVISPELFGEMLSMNIYHDPAWTGAPTLVGVHCTPVRAARFPSNRVGGFSTVCWSMFDPWWLIVGGPGVALTPVPLMPAELRQDGSAQLTSTAPNVVCNISIGAGSVTGEPGGTQVVDTLFAGTTFYGSTSMDPGPAIRFDLHVDSPIRIQSIGVNLLNDGSTNFGITTPNLIGAPNGTMEVWTAGPSTTVNDPALFTGNPYAHLPLPGVPPIAPWVQLTSSASHLHNLVYAPPDRPSFGAFAGGLPLSPGDYAVVVVLVPQGVAGPSGVAANPTTDRIHPLFTNMNLVPGPASYGDDYVRISSPGVQSTAFAPGALSPTSPTPFMPNLQIRYELQSPSTTAYSAPYGVGCYRRPRTFYESFDAPGVPNTIDLTLAGSGGTRNGLDFTNLGDDYLVIANATPGLFMVPGSTPGALHLNSMPPSLTTTGAWDDATSGAIYLPFVFNYPGDGGIGTSVIDVSSNGICFLEPATTTLGFYDGFAGFVGNQPAIAAAWCDFQPADLYSSSGGTGDIWVDYDMGGSWVAITWDGVQEWNEPLNLSTVQLVLHSNGTVNIRYGAVGVNFSNAPVLVGFTPGHGAPDPGIGVPPRQAPDLSAAAAGAGFMSGNGAAPATLRLRNRPQVGRPLILETAGVGPSTLANLTILSTAQQAGIDLALLGMGGCAAWIALPDLMSRFQIGAGPFSWDVTAGGTLPASVAGVRLYAQSVQFTAVVPPVNAANMLVSDAVCIQIQVH